jgi:uncharacterized protein (DUF3084 family)
MPGLIVIVTVVIFGGGMAFLGDRVGMKVGKKRLSMFGLRPKYTSMIITVLTGFFIAAITLVALMLVSEYVRTAIFELHSIEEQLTKATRKAQKLTGAVLEKQRQIVKKQQEYSGLNLKYSKAREELTKIETELGKTRSNLSKVEVELGQTQLDLEVNQKVNHELQGKNQTLVAENDNLIANNQGLVVQNENLTQISDFLKKKNDDLNLERERLNRQIQNYEGELLSLQDRNKVIEEKPLLFYVGEILIAKIVEPGIKADNIQGMVINPLLQTANEIALKQGAKIPGKTDYALRIKPTRVTEVCRQLAQLKSKAVVRVIVENNSVADEPVNATLEVYPDEIIFKSGEKIVETELSADQPEAELRDRLLSLLILAYNKAIAKGIITNDQNLRNIVSISEIANSIAVIKQNTTSISKAALVATGDISRTSQFQVKIEIGKKKEGGEQKS